MATSRGGGRRADLSAPPPLDLEELKPTRQGEGVCQHRRGEDPRAAATGGNGLSRPYFSRRTARDGSSAALMHSPGPLERWLMNRPG